MPLESIASTLGIDAFKAAIRSLRKKLSSKRYEQLISSAVAELLKEHPDIDAAEANLLAAEATGATPSRALLRAKDILGRTKSHSRKKSKKKPARRKAKKKAKRKAARKKT